MPPGAPPSRGFRGFLKGVARRAKRVSKPGSQNSVPSAPPPVAEPSSGAPLSQPVPAHEQLLQPPAQTEQPATSPQLQSDPGEATSTAPLVPTDGTQSGNPESRLPPAIRKAGADAWLGLKSTLQLLEKADVFLPLKSAVAGFLEVVDIFETAAQNRDDYAELASNLRVMIDEFREHPGEQTSAKVSEALQAMTSGLEQEMEHVQGQQQRSGIRRRLQAGQDLDDVQGCYRRVETLCSSLQNKALTQIWNIVEEQKQIAEGQKRIAEEQQVVRLLRGEAAEFRKWHKVLQDARLNELSAVLKAMYDSNWSDVIGRHKCTPSTRELILAEMREWADNPDGPKVYWLNGMAGTGKTTLAYSLCVEMQLVGRLGASFFCSRGDADSQNVSRIVPTIAHQPARLLPEYREALIRQIGEDKDIGARKIETQFGKLIRDPLLEIKASVPGGIIVTIDALDECLERDGARLILDVLFRHAQELAVKFFVTCRPEPGLFDVLDSEDKRRRSVLHLHDIEASFVQADIQTYLQAELPTIPEDKLRQLAEKAGCLFIYAATAVRNVRGKGRKVNLHRRIEDVLSMAPGTDTDTHKRIDHLYTAVLAAPFADEDLSRKEKRNIRLVLDTAVCAKEAMSVTTMAKLLGLDDEQDITDALQHLRSVLHVSDSTSLISTLHASFPDFMRDRDRSGGLGCNTTEHSRHLALCCFSTMQRLLHFNTCNLESSFVFDANVPNLAKRIDERISPELFYACRYWEDHLGVAEPWEDGYSALGEFLLNRLLFWMEVMNLRNCIGVGAEMSHRAHSWLQKSGKANDILELALDAGRFVTAFGLSPASRSTPHIYISALPFWPETRAVRQRYWQYTRGLIRLEGPAMESRDLSCLATWKVTGPVNCVAFSQDGTLIFSGSSDKTIRILDARSGDVVAGPFMGHTRSVTSVAFSPDGTRIVSGSNDGTIRVLDARSGDVVAGPFQGHTESVWSVGFSLDGTRIVSGSWDKTIRVWDAGSGDVVAGPFKGHIDPVLSVGFSPDGARIVSGSWDKTIRVWDAHSGDVVAGPFKEHTGPVSSVGFSPDGTRVVSGSHDGIIRVLDVRSGDVAAGPFQGHTSRVTSVGFSPNGTRIVSGSSDNTIRVWDARSGDVVAGPLEGHTDSVSSVGFSPDGTRFISGSSENTVHLWDASAPDMLDACPHGGWTMDAEGLVTTRQEQLLLCVPADLHSALSWPRNTLCIYTNGSPSLDFRGLFLGRDWAKCYRCD